MPLGFLFFNERRMENVLLDGSVCVALGGDESGGRRRGTHGAGFGRSIFSLYYGCT